MGYRLNLVCALGLASMGCGFKAHDPEGAPVSDAPADARPIERFIYAGSETQLAVVDIETKTAMMLGRFIDVATSAQLTMYELALRPDGELLGITAPPAAIYTIDKLTGRGTRIAALDINEQYWGATTAPAGELESQPVVFAGTPGGKLYRISTTDGHVTEVGSFGGGASVSGDLVWVRGAGLFGTMNGPTCNDCLMRISPTTGAATQVKALATGDFYATGSLNGRLFVFRGAGEVYELDPATGNELDHWSMPGAWSVAAP